MLYQRKISGAELLAAKLELHLHHARFALVGAHAVGVAAVVALLWFQASDVILLSWAVAMLTLLLVHSVRMSGALEGERFIRSRFSVYVELIAGAVLLGVVWSGTVFWLDGMLSDQMFYLLVLIVTIISVVAVAVTSVVREVYMANLFATLIPVATWLAWHYDGRAFNLMLAALLTALSLLMALASGWMSRSFGDMIQSSLEREAMNHDFAELSESLRLKNQQLQEARQQLADIATIDELTGLKNRRGANQVFETEISRARRAGFSLAIIMLDVDHFKLYNDTYGHPSGDLVLQKLAEVLMGVTSRAGELAVRMGGEEFMMILPGSTSGDAMSTAEAVRERVAALKMLHASSPTGEFVSVSQGVVACVPGMNTEISDLIDAADKALYDSKDAGRNAITLSAYRP